MPDAKEIPHWVCVGCSAIQPESGEYPKACWSCQATEFIRDTITKPEPESECPFGVKGCPGFGSEAAMYDLCDDCYEGRRAIGERE